MIEDRLTRHELNINAALLVSLRGTCARAKVGAVIVKEGRVISSGYNGKPPTEGLATFCLTTCDTNKPCQDAIHAEANAIFAAASQGIALKGAILYCTHSPCRKCSEAILQSGISEVYYLKSYHAHDSSLLESRGIKVTQLENPRIVIVDDTP